MDGFQNCSPTRLIDFIIFTNTTYVAVANTSVIVRHVAVAYITYPA